MLTFSITGYVNGDQPNVVSGAPVMGTLADTNSPASGTPYAIAVSAGSLSAANYAFTFTPGNLTVTQAVLTVTAADQTKVYGSANPVLTANYSGFANGEDATVLTTQVNLTTTAADFSPVGGYAITASGIVASNYAAVYVAGNLSVTAAPLTASITVGDKIYDGTTSATIATRALAGVLNGDDVSLIGGTAGFLDKNAAAGKTVNATGLTLSGATAGNYALASGSATTMAAINPRLRWW